MQASGAETLQQVAGLFNLSLNDVLADNQGVISGPNDSLEGRSILLCTQTGQLPQASVPLVLLPSTRVAGPAAAPASAPRPAPRPATAASSPAGRLRAGGSPPGQATGGTRPKPPANVKVSNVPFVPPTRQKEGLLAMKAYLDPANKVLVDWTNKLDHCTWVYVTCDGSKNVIRLNLVYLNLEGKLPSARIMNNLPYLKQLYLGGNSLSGTLPADWGRSLRTTELFLNDNMLQGSIPAQWGDMKTLRVLSLPYNQLQGSLPPALGQLVNLEVLKLNDNKLSGSVPQAWAGLKALKTLTLFNNQNVSGCVPEIWRGKGRSGKGYFQSPQGFLSDDIKVATIGTSIQGYCCKGWKYCV
eukprot:gene3037-3318_t